MFREGLKKVKVKYNYDAKANMWTQRKVRDCYEMQNEARPKINLAPELIRLFENNRCFEIRTGGRKNNSNELFNFTSLYESLFKLDYYLQDP